MAVPGRQPADDRGLRGDGRDRVGLLVRQELEDAAATWAREGRDAAGLYGGVRLASAQGWAADRVHFRELTQAGRDFLAAFPRDARRRDLGLSYSAPLGRLATGSPTGSRVWETNPSQVAANICQTMKAPVRPVLWKEYLPDIPDTLVCG